MQCHFRVACPQNLPEARSARRQLLLRPFCGHFSGILQCPSRTYIYMHTPNYSMMNLYIYIYFFHSLR